MQTFLNDKLLDTADGQRADSILRTCVHCGFCNATCPTWLETANELDSPRGRIYLIKNMLEQGSAGQITQTHLDRCLTCQSCETTCPSDVNYHELLDIGRRHLATLHKPPVSRRLKAWGMRRLILNKALFKTALKLARVFSFMLPEKYQFPVTQESGQSSPQPETTRHMLILDGCAQAALTPQTNTSAIRVFARLGISLEQEAAEGCCGAFSYHTYAQEEGLAVARKKIDLLCKSLDSGVEAIVSTASGCGNFIHQYQDLFSNDTEYADKARRVSKAVRDIGDVLNEENLSRLRFERNAPVAFQIPCSLQHGLGSQQNTKAVLQQAGITVTACRESHVCCGSAGSYSLMEPEMASRLQQRKLTNLMQDNPEQIVTSNIGCQLHLQKESSVPVTHWICLLDKLLVD